MLSIRIAAAAFGGYALCWTFVVCLCAWLPFDKVTRWYLAGQLAPLPFLAALLWAFIAKTAWRAFIWPMAAAGGFALLGALR